MHEKSRSPTSKRRMKSQGSRYRNRSWRYARGMLAVCSRYARGMLGECSGLVFSVCLVCSVAVPVRVATTLVGPALVCSVCAVVCSVCSVVGPPRPLGVLFGAPAPVGGSSGPLGGHLASIDSRVPLQVPALLPPATSPCPPLPPPSSPPPAPLLMHAPPPLLQRRGAAPNRALAFRSRPPAAPPPPRRPHHPCRRGAASPCPRHPSASCWHLRTRP